jgi:hypothetical protein
VRRLVFLAVLLGFAAACSQQKFGGKEIVPSSTVVNMVVKKSGAPALLSRTSTTRSSTGACSQMLLNDCGCLPIENWFTDGKTIFDAVCCMQTGLEALYSCGDNDCDDSGSAVTCR